MDTKTVDMVVAPQEDEAGPAVVAPVAVRARLPFNGWRKVATTPDVPQVFAYLENDVIIDTVTADELRAFYKQYGLLLRGVKQNGQLQAIRALRGMPGMILIGWANGPVLGPTPTPIAGLTSTIDAASEAASGASEESA